MSNEYYLFKKQGRNYLYNSELSTIVELNDNIYDIICRYEKSNITKDEYKIINSFIECGLLGNINNISDDLSSFNKIAYLSFAPTYKCNLRCAYCFGEYGLKYKNSNRCFDVRSLEKMLNFFFLEAFPTREKYRLDFVSGGEPLMGFDIIKETIRYVENFKRTYNKNVSLWLCTNSVLINEDIIKFLSNHNVSIGISIDGRKEYNDSVRVDINGKGTYDRICSKIQLIKKSTRVSRRFKNIWGLCTATNTNCDFVDILKHMHSLGFEQIQTRLVRWKEGYDIEKIIANYSSLAEFLLEEFKNKKFVYLEMILNDNDQFGKVLKRVMLDIILFRRCAAGQNKITLCPDGSIYPCDSFVGIENFRLGNYLEDNFNSEKYKHHNIDKIDKCSRCDIKYLCGGDCFYNSYIKTGNPNIPDENFCTLQRHIIEEAIFLRYRMQKIDEDSYELLLKRLKRKADYAELFG